MKYKVKYYIKAEKEFETLEKAKIWINIKNDDCKDYEIFEIKEQKVNN